MKHLIIFLLIASSELFAQGQGSADKKDFVYTPRKYNAIAATGESLMTAKIANISTQDTIQGIVMAGFSEVWLNITQATGTQGGLVVKYQASNDGQTYGTNLVTVDSINWTAAGAIKPINLSLKAGGAYSIRPVISGSTGPAFTGTNTYSVQVRKKK